MVIFFKEKAAYEMRISDWRSALCSSDLAARQLLQLRFSHLTRPFHRRTYARQESTPAEGECDVRQPQDPAGPRQRHAEPAQGDAPLLRQQRGDADRRVAAVRRRAVQAGADREDRRPDDAPG